MSDVLSQDEIDNLINGVETEGDVVSDDIFNQITDEFSIDVPSPSGIIPTDITPPRSNPKSSAPLDNWFLPNISPDLRDNDDWVKNKPQEIALLGNKYLHTQGSNFYSLINE
jgi:hypothetical protein